MNSEPGDAGLYRSTAGSSHQLVDPLRYPGWDDLVGSHPEGSFFHTASWARVLRETYAHVPFYLCRLSESGRELRELLPIMEVAARFTGRRGVSLPFSDFCEPILDRHQGGRAIYEEAFRLAQDRQWNYLEGRSDADWGIAGETSISFHGHVIELDAKEEELLNRLDSAVRRALRKAEREGLRVEISGRLGAVRVFYGLHCQTRARHGLPPQPVRFFENIGRHVMEQGRGFVATAFSKGKAIASAVFFHHREEAIYKFGASDFQHQNHRPNDLVMWEGIKESMRRRAARLHLGRTSLANEGLRRFKAGFGAREIPMAYRRYDFRMKAFVKDQDRAQTWVNRLFRAMPQPLLRLAGEALYPHLS